MIDQQTGLCIVRAIQLWMARDFNIEMKLLLKLTALAEAATEVALLMVPALVSRLLLGAEVSGVAIPIARVTGIALIALGVGCWPEPALAGMSTYSVLVILRTYALTGG